MGEPSRAASAAFPALPTAARRAREFTARILGSWELTHVAETAVLLVSELITNAVTHAGGLLDPPAGATTRVTLDLSLGESLRIAVSDPSGTPPVRRVAADDAENGRGLELVDLLSKEWGCDVLAGGGKAVWATLEVGDV